MGTCSSHTKPMSRDFYRLINFSIPFLLSCELSLNTICYFPGIVAEITRDLS